jgi:hypothetical protein
VPTRTPTNTPTNTAVVPTRTPTNTPTNTAVVPTRTPTNTPTRTPTRTPTNTRVPPTATETPVCPVATPTRQPTPPFTPGPGCSTTPPAGALEADITISGGTSTAVFVNHSATCSYPIGLAVYKRFDNNIDNQELFDYRLAVIPPDSTLTLTVQNPPCAFQVDAFWGPVLYSLNGQRYGQRLLDDIIRTNGGFCVPSGCPTTTPVPTVTAAPPTATPTCVVTTPTRIATPAFTPAPGCTDAPPHGVLTALITDHPNFTEATFRNRSPACSYRIGLAVYKKFDNNINHQELYDYRLAVIPPDSTLTLQVNNPPCAYQGDAFYGDLIVSFAGGVRYGPRRLDDTDGVRHDFCVPVCPPR